jgi:hypothetical protein
VIKEAILWSEMACKHDFRDRNDGGNTLPIAEGGRRRVEAVRASRFRVERREEFYVGEMMWIKRQKIVG